MFDPFSYLPYCQHSSFPFSPVHSFTLSPFLCCGCFIPLQSLDEDCTLEEEDDGLIEEEDAIDQFNDDTFGAGAIGKEFVN